MTWNFLSTDSEKIPRSEFDKFESYLDPDMDEIFLTCLVESEYVYGVFFCTNR